MGRTGLQFQGSRRLQWGGTVLRQKGCRVDDVQYPHGLDVPNTRRGHKCHTYVCIAHQLHVDLLRPWQRLAVPRVPSISCAISQFRVLDLTLALPCSPVETFLVRYVLFQAMRPISLPLIHLAHLADHGVPPQNIALSHTDFVISQLTSIESQEGWDAHGIPSFMTLLNA